MFIPASPPTHLFTKNAFLPLITIEGIRIERTPHALTSLRFCCTRLQMTPAFRTEAYFLSLCTASYSGERPPTEPTILPVCRYLLVTHRTPAQFCLRGLRVRPIECRRMIKAPCEQGQLSDLLAS